MTSWANTESRAARRRRRIRGETVLETIALAAMRAATVMLSPVARESMPRAIRLRVWGC
mgnify:CR=1 FL=1